MCEHVLRVPALCLALAALALGACVEQLPEPEPLGPYSIVHLGSTENQNKFDPYDTPDCPSDDLDAGTRPEQDVYEQAEDPPLNVLALIADSNDFRFTGNAADRTAWRNAKLNDYETNTRDFWDEASYGTIQVGWTMPDRILNMSGAFNDYFNRSFVAASLTTRGLSGTFPLALDGTATATLHVRDKDRNVDVTFAPNANFADLGALVVACQNTFDAVPAVPAGWVTCSSAGGELRMQLADSQTKEGSFLRVKSGAGLATLGLDGPEETPGEGAARAALKGLAVGYPLALTGTESVTLEVRDKDRKTRRYPINLPAGNVADPNALAALLLPALNAEFNWVESFNAGAGRLGLRIVAASNGSDAAVRVVGGTNHGTLGLAGPMRVDGVVTEAGTDTVRGSRAATVAEALSLPLAARAAALGLAVSAANQAQLDGLVAADFGGVDSFMVLFIDSMTGIPGKRAGAGGGPFDIRVPGAGGYVYQKQVNAALQIGTGAEDWETWAHELGHNLGMWDVYAQPWHDPLFDRSWDYLKVWSMMNDHWGENHPDGWHKHMAGWLPGGLIENIGKPPAAGSETTPFTLLPLEYPAADYAGVGSGTHPARQLARIELSPEHWLLLENRQPGAAYSQNLPDDDTGRTPPAAGAQAGGLLITDTVNPGSDFLYRSAVTVLNPHGNPPAPAGGWVAAQGIENGDTFDPNTSFPAYDGIEVRVVGTEPGPGGRPEALRVEVERGPGDHLDLRIRPWHSPNVYGTPDIWIDWPGDGEEDYSAMDPPVGNGDDTHWHPDGSVTNKIRVRIHNDGTILGRNVVVRAYVNEPMGMGASGNFVPLPDSAPQDIPANSFRDFAFDWNPKSKGHTCVRAQILSHDSDLGELDLSNNAAQENVNDFHPVAGSPYAPVDFEFTVNSDFPDPIEVEFRASGLPPGMDLELESDWVELAPDEERTLRGRLTLDETVLPPLPPDRRKCRYRFNVHAFIRTPDYVLPFGGITIATTPTKASELELRGTQQSENPDGVPGVAISGLLKGDWPASQQVDAVVVSDVDGLTYSGTATTGAGGSFTILVEEVPPGDAKLMLYYFGPSLAPSTLGPVPIKI